MNIDDLTKSTGEWLRGVGPMSDVVVSARIRLARNVADHPFLTAAAAGERTEIYRSLSHAITSTSAGADDFLVDLETADAIDRNVLVERHLISRQHAAGEGSRGMGLKADDLTAIPLAHKYHQEIHAIGRRSFEEKYHVNLWELIAKTQAEYIRETGL